MLIVILDPGEVILLVCQICESLVGRRMLLARRVQTCSVSGGTQFSVVSYRGQISARIVCESVGY